jgi:FlaA1/EpsC-like NDP-sugar epimerase
MPPGVLVGLVRAADGLALFAGYVVTRISGLELSVAPALAAAVLALFAFELLGLDRLAELQRLSSQLARLSGGLAAAFAVVALTVSALPGPTLAAAVAFAGVVAGRAAMARLVARLAAAGRLTRRAVVFGTGEISAATIEQLSSDLDCGIRIVGVFDDRGADRASGLVAGYPWLGTSADLLDFARETRVDLVILARPLTAERRLAEIVKRLSVPPVAIKLPAAATPLRLAPRAYSHAGHVAMIDVIDLPMSDWGPFLKRALDVAVSLPAIIVLSPSWR